MFRTVIAVACLALAASHAERKSRRNLTDCASCTSTAVNRFSLLMPPGRRSTPSPFRSAVRIRSNRSSLVLLMDLADTGNGGASRFPRDCQGSDRTARPLVRNNRRERTDEHHDEPRTGPRGDNGPGAPDGIAGSGGCSAEGPPAAAHPESIFYLYLTSPRVAAPRWYQEGIAVFVDTWMGGGLGRAQGGYDEMVFRTMVRDDAPSDPLGLVSEGRKSISSSEIDSYLYGTRFMTWLARRYSPEQVIAWTARRDGSRAYYAASFARCSASPRRGLGRSGSAKNARSSRQICRHSPASGNPFQDITMRALGSVSRAYFDPVATRFMRHSTIPASSRISGRSMRRWRRRTGSRRSKGPVIYTVTSVAWNPDERVLSTRPITARGATW